MKLRTRLFLFLPLGVSACITLPETGTDHPAHPDALTAYALPLSNTLALQEPSSTAMPTPADEPSSATHDHGAREGAPIRPQGQEQATLYWCPMDTQVVQDKPGNCPICGMRLEPKPGEVETDENGDGHDHDR